MEKPTYTITRILYLTMGATFFHGPIEPVPTKLKLLVNFAEELTRIWEEAEEKLMQELGHRRVNLLSIEVYDDRTEPQWEETSRPCGPHVRFLVSAGRLTGER